MGSKNIHILVGSSYKNSIQVDKALVIPTPSKALADGRIEDAAALQSAILQGLSASKIRAKKVIVTVNSSSIITREITLPVVKEEDLSSMVEYEIAQYLPITLDDYVIDYKVLDKLEEDVPKYRLQVAVVPKALTSGYFHFISDLNLKPAVLDIHSNSVSKLFAYPMVLNGDIPYSLDQTLAVIDMGHERTNVHIISKGKMEFSRLVPLGGANIDADIAGALDIPLSEAEGLKMAKCDLAGLKAENERDRRVNQAIEARINLWAGEIQRIFQYYSSRNTGNQINSIFLSGGSSNLSGIESYLERLWNIPTRKLNKVDTVKILKKQNDFRPELYLNNLGALIRLL